MSGAPTIVLEEIEALKQQWRFDEALKKANALLVRNPTSKEVLYQVADIEYRKGEISKAEKPVDFLLTSQKDDAMSWYIKWVLEMEKTHWKDAKRYFQKSLELLDGDNPEIMRCYGLCEYWLGNREEGMEFLMKSHKINKFDAEVLLNIIEISILEKNKAQAQRFLEYYHKNKEKLQCFDRDLTYYDDKITLFEEYLRS